MNRKLTAVFTSIGILATMGVVGLAGCAGERNPIDRTQPYALQKSLFVGSDLLDPIDNPEFYAQGTLIDVGGYGASQDGLFISTYTQSVSRLKWQITEDLLLGRLAYERIENADGHGAGPATNDGTIVVAYRIEKHFDIVRSYNPTTGEELNVIEENSVDRPWYERGYMRVDWSKNLNVDAYDFDTLALLQPFGGIIYEPMNFDITNPEDPNAPIFDLENGYFDITNKAFAKPKDIDLSSFGWGIDSIPACFLPNDFMGGTNPAGTCNPVELTIRQSFRRVEDTDYEPVHWDGLRFQAYGVFTVDRYGYAYNYGMSDDRWYRFATRYNIWERSHYYDDPINMLGPVECNTPTTTPFGSEPTRDLDHNGTHDECESVGLGSKCDRFKQRCTLPYAQRQTVTTPWYYNSHSDPLYFDATTDATHEWDVALRMAAQSARYAECNITGGDNCIGRFMVHYGQQEDNLDTVMLAREIDACRAANRDNPAQCATMADTIGAKRGLSPSVINTTKLPEMIVLCHSPVEANDHLACGSPRLPASVSAADCFYARQEGTDKQLLQTCDEAINVRLGDLRYHQINVITEASTPQPWGIYTDAEDPLTGETFSACVNVWSSVTARASQGVIDQVRYMRKELSTADITEGQNVRDWSQAAETAGRDGALPRMSLDQLSHNLASFSGGSPEAIRNFDVKQFSPGLSKKLHDFQYRLSGVSASLQSTSTMAPIYGARRNAAIGTEFEAKLMTPMVQEMQGLTGLPLTHTIMNIASPLRGGNPSFQRDIYNLNQAALAERGTCILHPREATVPLAITGLANVLEEKFGAFNPADPPAVQNERAENMRQWLARRLHMTVIVHEMGHSIGLRHNFVSSSDAWGYRPQYWQLRTKNGQVATECKELSATGEECIGPRYFDPVTQEEQDNMIWTWMQSSVMEYPGEITQDMLGLGVWDFAAARMVYGDVVAVAQDPKFKATAALGKSMIEKMDNFGGVIGMRPSINGQFYHYAQLHNRLGLINNCEEVDPADFKPENWNQEKDGVWSPLVDGFLVQVDGVYTRCKTQKVDYVPWDTLRMPNEAEAPGFYRGGPSVDILGRTRMPYGFATDGWADLGNLSVYRHDNGADAYEIFNFMITQESVGHIFDAYRRGRQTFSVRGAANRSMSRYYGKMRDGAKGLGLMKNVYEEFALNEGLAFTTLWPSISRMFFTENILASAQAFDHFTRVLSRPEAGAHFYPRHDDQVLVSENDFTGNPPSALVNIPNGATGYFGNMAFGGRLVENQLGSGNGEYDRDYTLNCGSYYDKLNMAMIMTESVDNFISDSRDDFVDPRYRAVSLADLFPDGYRRWLANNLTGDEALKGARVIADASGMPLTEAAGSFPTAPIGWTTWWGDDVEACFPNDGTTICTSYTEPNSGAFNPNAPEHTAVLNAQVGWEQQKFLIAWTMLYLPENEKMHWIDMMRLWELGLDSNPEFANRIEFHNPTGKIYVAKTYGKETIFGKTVQKGISARVLEYANELLALAYETTDGPDLDGDGNPDWYEPVYSATTGEPLIKYDDTIDNVNEFGSLVPGGLPGCDENDNYDCTCNHNRACMELSRYVSIPAFMREALSAFQFGTPDQRGIY